VAGTVAATEVAAAVATAVQREEAGVGPEEAPAGQERCALPDFDSTERRPDSLAWEKAGGKAGVGDSVMPDDDGYDGMVSADPGNAALEREWRERERVAERDEPEQAAREGKEEEREALGTRVGYTL
jgi:hypothetical protein